MNENLTGLQRLWLAFVAFFAILFDRRFAEEVHAVRGRLAALPAGATSDAAGQGAAPRARAPATPSPAAHAPAPASTRVAAPAPAPAPAPSAAAPDGALHVLHLLQRDGRLVDFLSEDLAGFSDAEIGAAARTVHEGCKKTLDAYVKLEPVYVEAEGARVTVGKGFDPATVRLTGNVVGAPPFQGSLKHHGWRVTKTSFPPAPPGGAARILAPAEVEL